MDQQQARPASGALVGEAVTRSVRPRSRLRSPSPAALDLILGGAVVVLGLAESGQRALSAGLPLIPLDLTGPYGTVIFALVATVPLMVRSRFPLAVMVLSCLGLLACEWLTQNNLSATWFSPFVAAFSAGLIARDRRRVAIAFASMAALAVPIWAYGLSTGAAYPWDILVTGLFFGIWLAGDRIRSGAEQAVLLSQRADRLERERDLEAVRAAADERARIARELHDVIAHSLSVMVIQASAAMRILDDQPEQARQSMHVVEETGRAAMTEMRRLLGVIRRDDRAAPTDPQPSMERLSSLVEELSEAGLPIELLTEGEVRSLPAGLDVSAYRIVQEALTNVLRHAGKARATVTVRYLRDAVELEIVDDGAAAAWPRPNAEERVGHGLVGMRERVALLQGAIDVGPQPGGGFAVRARLPLDGAGGDSR